MGVIIVSQGDEDRIDTLERAVVTLHSELMAEMDRRFDRVDARIDRVDDQLVELRGEVHTAVQSTQQTMIKLQQTIIVVGAGLMGTVVASLIAVLAAGV